MPDPRDPGDDAPLPPRTSAVPFVVAAVGFVIIAMVALVFLRADDEGELVRPDRLTDVDEDTIRAVALEQPGCGHVERAQVDLAENEVFVELVVVDRSGDCTEPVVDVIAEVTLPEPIGDRRLVPGVGRLQLPCRDVAGGDPWTVTCAPAG